MSATDREIYRYLRFKDGFVEGRTLCRAMSIPSSRLKSLDMAEGVGSVGPCTRRPLSPTRYAKYNAFNATFIAFFKWDGRYRCLGSRKRLRPGCSKPKITRVRRKRKFRHD